MTVERKIIAVLSAIILIACSLAGYEMVRAHIATVVATVQQDAAQAAKAVDDRNIAARDAQQAEYQKAIATQQANVKTAAQSVTVIDHYVPSATPQDAPVVIQKAELPAVIQAKLPDAPSYVVTTEDQSVAIAKKLLQGDADAQAVVVCKADLADTRNKVVLSEQETATWKKSAKGGSAWTRIRSAGKYLILGGAMAITAKYIIDHN